MPVSLHFVLQASLMETETDGLRRQADTCSAQNWGSFSDTFTVGWEAARYCPPPGASGLQSIFSLLGHSDFLFHAMLGLPTEQSPPA